MPVHPAPPADVTELVDAYRQTLSSFCDVADSLREQEWDLPTACPGWTARDHLAHVVHVEDYLSGSEHPGAGWSGADDEPVRVGEPEHVRHSLGVWIEEGVRARRGQDPRAMVAELRGLVEVRAAGMYDPDLELDTPVRSLRGRQATFEELTRRRIFDVWVHEQDLRDALDRPGSLDSPGASEVVSQVLDALPRIVLEKVRPEPGTVVILECTGPVTARGGVRIGTDADGDPVAHELFTGQTSDEDDVPSVDDESADRTTSIALSTHALGRRAAGRCPTDGTAYQVTGDEELARTVLDALSLTP